MGRSYVRNASKWVVIAKCDSSISLCYEMVQKRDIRGCLLFENPLPNHRLNILHGPSVTFHSSCMIHGISENVVKFRVPK